MEFACTKLAADKVVRCAFGLTKQEYNLFMHLCSFEKEYSTRDLQEKFSLNLATVQRALKKMHDVGLLIRSQANFEGGGYEFVYSLKPRKEIRALLKERLGYWMQDVQQEVETWSKKKFA